MNKKVEFLFNLSIILGVLGYVALDLPFRTLISVSIFLFLPGYLILKTINLELGKFWHQLTLSIAFSFSFLMIFGFLFNHLFSSLGFNRPLDYTYIGFGSILIILSFIRFNQRYIKDRKTLKEVFFSSISTVKIFFISLSIFIVILSVFSTFYMRRYDIVIYTFFTYLSISISFIFVWLLRNKISEKIYALLILSYGLSIAILLVFKSSHFYGDDIYFSYYLAENIAVRGEWILLPENTSLLNSLAVTLFLPVLNSIGGLNLVHTFKLLITITVSLTPLILYLILRKFLNPFLAFIGSIFYISSMWFPTQNVGLRTQLAFLFVGIFILVWCGNKESQNKKFLLGIIALFSVIISHYATTYALVIVLVFAFLWVLVRSKLFDDDITYKLHAKLVFSFLIMVYLWNSYIAHPFESGVGVIERSFLGFFYGVEEHTYREAAMGAGAQANILEYYLPLQFEWVLMWIIIICISIGALYVLLNTFFSSKTPSKKIKESWIEKYLDSDYFALSVGGFFVAAILFLPGMDPGMGISRTWGLLTLFFAPLFLIGSNLIFKKGNKQYVVVIIILTVYFISVTGASYYAYDQIEEDSMDIEIFKGRVLNTRNESMGMAYEIYEQELKASYWLNSNSEGNKSIWQDGAPPPTHLHARVRISGPFREDKYVGWREGIETFSNYTINDFDNISGYLYLRYVNVEMEEYNTIDKFEYDSFEEIYQHLQGNNHFNKIYSNGGSEIYLSM